jgi:hypothetical protein
MTNKVEVLDAFDRSMKKLADFKRDVQQLIAVLDDSWDIMDRGDDKKYNALADAAEDVKKWI